MTEAQIREEICRIGKSLFDRGYVHATAGNISFKLDESVGGGFLITPTDSCLGALDPASLAKLDSNGIQVSGDKASKTISLHKNIYEASRKINLPAKCVIHTHSTYCVAASIFGYSNSELLPPITPYFVMKVGHVPLIPYHKPGDATVAKLVSETIVKYADLGKPIRSVMLSKLGPNVWHSSLGAAMATLEELEETAKLWILSNQAAPSLTQNEIQDLKTVFHCSW